MALNNDLIVRILSLSLCLILGMSFGQASHTLDALNSYNELQLNFISDKDKFSEVHPEPTFLPSSERIQPSSFSEVPPYRPSNEEIAISGDNSKQKVQNIEAVNTAKQRTIVYDDVQRGDGVNEGNSMNIEISGNGQEKQSVMDMDDAFGNAIEEKVDSAIASRTNPESWDNTGTIHSQVNNLNIDVSGISVRAINTVPGGTAIATSNIKIVPVQIIVEPSEASEKLK